MEMPMAEVTTTPAQTNTEAATEVKADPSTLLGEGAPESQNTDTPKVDGEAKTDGAKVDEPAVPEKYEFKLPEGYELDEGALKVFEPALKDLKLTNDGAQKLVDAYAQVQKLQLEESEKAFNAQVEKWAEDVKADKELGGQAFEQTRTDALRAVGKYGTPELKALLNQTGLGNHPEFVRFFTRIGKSLKEDDPIVTAGTAGGSEKSIEERLWPKH